MSVRIFSAHASLFVSSALRVITVCWKPEDLVKKRTFFFAPPDSVCPRTWVSGESANPAPTKAAAFRTSRRLHVLIAATVALEVKLVQHPTADGDAGTRV